MPSALQLLTSPAFGLVGTGVTSTLQMVLANFGDEDVAIDLSDISVDTGLGYSVSNLSQLSVPANDAVNVTFDISWTAGAVGVTPDSNLTITTSDPGSPIVAPVTSQSVAGGKVLSADPSAFTFPNTKVGEDSAIQIFSINNVGSMNVTVTGYTFPVGWVAAAPVPTFPQVVTSPAGVLQFGVQFAPAGQGFASEEITIQSDAAAGDLSFAVSGTGYLITPAFIVTGDIVLLAAFGNTVLQFDQNDLNCEEVAFVKRDVNLTAPGLEDSMLQMQLNHEAKGTSTLELTAENQRNQTFSVDIDLSTETNDKIRTSFGSMNSTLTGEVLTVTLTHAADDGPASITGYILRHVPAGEVKPT